MSSCSSPEPDFRSGLCTPPPSPPSPLSSAAFPSHAKWKLCAATLESQSHPSHLFRPFTSSLSFSFSASTSLSYPWRSASISFSYSSLQLSFCPRRHPWMSLLEWRPSVPDKCLCVCVRVRACACVGIHDIWAVQYAGLYFGAPARSNPREDAQVGGSACITSKCSSSVQLFRVKFAVYLSGILATHANRLVHTGRVFRLHWL